MSDNKIQITPTGETLTIREGEAAPIIQPRPIAVEGTIAAPADWYEGKKRNGFVFDLSRLHVLFSIERRVITLKSEDHISEHGDTITGKVRDFAPLTEFGINARRKHTPKELAAFLKMMRSLFVDGEANRRIVANLNNLIVAVDRKIQDTNDFRGNKVAAFEQKVKTEIDLNFNLSSPLFVGGEKLTFNVEIMLDVTDAGVRLWLESAELKELQDTEAARLMNAELERLAGLTLIEQA